jgi:ABC-type lipoprotein release transport system permease subunit
MPRRIAKEVGMRTLFNLVMRIVSSLLGLLLVAMGAIWMMQGLGVGPDAIMRGFMVNDIHWAVYGAIAVLFGIGQVIWSNTRQNTI